MNNTREENFSDFSKIPSFQGSYVSSCSTNKEESFFKSGHMGQTQSNVFQALAQSSSSSPLFPGKYSLMIGRYKLISISDWLIQNL